MPQRIGIRGVAAVAMTAFLALALSLPDRAAAGDVVASPPSALVQFRSFMAPITQPGRARKPGLKAVTVIVEIGESEAENVCSNLPRIRDAVLVELFRQPIALDRQTGMDTKPVEARLLEPVNRVLGNAAIRRIYVLPGTEQAAGAAAARLPYPVMGCRPPRNRKA
jgi:hypothetical protein